MEFLARLIGGSGSNQTKQPANNPQQRLAKFKRIYSQTLQIWHKVPSSKNLDLASLHTVQTNLQRLASILEDDTRAPVPRLCLSFATSSYVYTGISRIALASNNDGVVREAATILTILVDNDEENLLGTERFAETVMNFVDAVLGYNTYVSTSETQGEVLELMFGIAAKIRLEPELLPVWFRGSTTSMPSEKTAEDGLQAEDKIDFPLCHQFVGHVYHEGRVGDFARTGLLYMFESASNSAVLESWIVNSDLPTLLASGLGALYSQLSRKLHIALPDENLPLVLALSNSHRSLAGVDAESFYSEDLQSRLSTFMSYMTFWQDVLKQCYSADIKQTLIDHFQVFFLQQILYPSLLESSDADGGSSVAVLTYLWSILDSIEHPDIINMILGYLLALSDPLDSNTQTPRSPAIEKRRISLLSLSQAEQSDDAMTPSYFNLTDMILASAQSHNVETVSAALRLVSLILTKYHSYALPALLRTTPANHVPTRRSVGELTQELDFLISLAANLAGVEGMDEGYSASLKDSLTLIESHACSQNVLAINDLSKQNQRPNRRGSTFSIPDPQPAQKHYIEANDPLLRILIRLLESFFTNSIEVNLGLTNVIVQLASCPLTRLEGWLVSGTAAEGVTNTTLESENENGESSPDSKESVDEAETLEQQRVDAYKAKRTSVIRSTGPILAFTETLKWLVESLRIVRAGIPQFETLLAGRKRAFQGATEIENERRDHGTPALSPSTPIGASRETSRTRAAAVPSKRNPQESFANTSRGRTLTAIVGGSRSSGGSPKSETSRRPKPLGSPVLRPSERSPDPSRSPSKLQRPMSPLKTMHNFNDADESNHDKHAPPVASTEEKEDFERKIRFPTKERGPIASQSHANEDNTEGLSDEGDKQATRDQIDAQLEPREASLTHVLTNVIILQEFILEIAAMIQVRAGLLDGEIDFV